jgi:hypothetical protein
MVLVRICPSSCWHPSNTQQGTQPTAPVTTHLLRHELGVLRVRVEGVLVNNLQTRGTSQEGVISMMMVSMGGWA